MQDQLNEGVKSNSFEKEEKELEDKEVEVSLSMVCSTNENG